LSLTPGRRYDARLMTNSSVEPSLAGARVLVTGASGFIGSALCQRLAQTGSEVHGVSRKPRTAAGPCAVWWQNELDNVDSVRDLFESARPEYVFDLASHVAGSRARELVLPTLRANLASAVNVLIGASESGCRRILMTGSMEEPPPGPAWSVPSSPYAAAKLAASAYARMFQALYGTPTVVLRPAMVYGPGQQDLKKLVPYVTLSLLRGEVPALSSGTRQADWIFVDDVVDGYVAAAVASGVEGATIDLGCGRLTSVRAVVEQLVEIIRPQVRPAFGKVPERALEQAPMADVEATSRLIGWRPSMELRAGLEETVRWYRTAT
jgi:UDP-glucose 4-epimerase